MPKPGLAILIGKMKPSKDIQNKHGLKMDKEEDLEGESESTDEGLVVAAEEILSAVEAKDANMLAESLKAFFDMCDEMPHMEGEHVEEEE